MRICLVWDAEYPWDVRAAKVARSLTEAGHDVHMVARNRDARPLEERLPECTVHRMAPLDGIGTGLSGASMFPAFFNPRWANLIERVSRRIEADVILCRDLPLTPTSVYVGRRLGIPVVLDMAENYPAMIRSVWENGRHRWSDWLVRNPAFVTRVENWSCRNVNHIIVVVEESRDRLAAMGVTADRMTIVSNTPPLDHLSSSTADTSDLADHEPLHVAYLGLLEAPRGISTLIQAVGIVRDRGVKVRLTLIGDGRERTDFEEEARRVDPSGGIIEFLGYLPNDEALRRLRSAHLGVIPHHADESWNTTIPNKLFDYMAAGLPVIGSDAPPVERVIDETGCGRAFRDRDPGSLAEKLIELRGGDVRRRAAEAGREAVRRKYNWGVDAGRLLEVVERVGRSGEVSAPPVRSHA